MKRFFIAALASALFFVYIALPDQGLAQGVSSVIRGTITDSSGAVVQSVAVTITDSTKGWSRVTVSGAAGKYELLELPPADIFLISVGALGFRWDRLLKPAPPAATFSSL